MPIDTTVASFSDGDMNSNITSLLVYEFLNGLWQLKGKVTSGGGNHAEEELAADLNGANQLNIAQGAAIRIEITKSPCNFHEDGKCCTQVLTGLKSSGRVGSIEVKYLGIYQSNTHGGSWTSIVGLMELELSGINCDALDPGQSPNPSQVVFFTQFQQKIKNGTVKKNFMTNPTVRFKGTQKKPSKSFWNTDLKKL